MWGLGRAQPSVSENKEQETAATVSSPIAPRLSGAGPSGRGQPAHSPRPPATAPGHSAGRSPPWLASWVKSCPPTPPARGGTLLPSLLLLPLLGRGQGRGQDKSCPLAASWGSGALKGSEGGTGPLCRPALRPRVKRRWRAAPTEPPSSLLAVSLHPLRVWLLLSSGAADAGPGTAPLAAEDVHLLLLMPASSCSPSILSLSLGRQAGTGPLRDCVGSAVCCLRGFTRHTGWLPRAVTAGPLLGLRCLPNQGGQERLLHMWHNGTAEPGGLTQTPRPCVAVQPVKEEGPGELKHTQTPKTEMKGRVE